MKAKISCAAVNFGLDMRLLDHIAPLAYLMEIPLFVTEEKNRDLLERYYPMVKTHFYWPQELSPQLFEKFDLLFQSTFWRPDEKAFFSLNRKKKLSFAYCPHGNSDKGYHSPMMALISEQDFVLLYGPHMQERLKKQKLWQTLASFAFVGNYRHSFYLAHQSFFDKITEQEIFSFLDPRKKTLLYAPTWKDPEDSSSFFSETKRLIQELPDRMNLLLKPHPLLEELSPALYQATIGLCEKKKNIKVIEEFPLIYPLLAKSDLYLGDFSSIGYDFLTFRKPMFFFASDKKKEKSASCFLRGCGREIWAGEKIFSVMEENLELSEEQRKKQEEMDLFSFGEKRSLLETKEEIFSKLQAL